MDKQRCGICRYLDRASATDIGGLPIAICCHPEGSRVGTPDSLSDYVALDYVCASHVSRFKATQSGNEPASEVLSGGSHA